VFKRVYSSQPFTKIEHFAITYSIMETDRLRQFCTVVDTGSFSRAADLLGISIGGLSKSIQVLEEDLGFKLFVPAGRGVVPSDRSKGVYVQAKKILDDINLLKNPQLQLAGEFKIGAIEVFTVHFMGELVQSKFSDRRIEIRELSPGALELAVEESEIDCGLTYIPRPRSDLDQLKLGSFETQAFVVRGTLEKVPFEELPFIVPSTGIDPNPFGIKESDGWPDDLVSRRKHHRVNMLSTALELARSGQGAVFMPDFVARLHNAVIHPSFKLVPVSLPRAVKRTRRDVYLIKRSSTIESADIKRLASGVRRLLGS